MINILTFSLPKSRHILHLINQASQSSLKYFLLSMGIAVLIVLVFYKLLTNSKFKAKHDKLLKTMKRVIFILVGVLSVSAIISGIIMNVDSIWMMDTEVTYIEYNCTQVKKYRYLQHKPFIKRLFKASKGNDLMHSPRFDYKYHHKMPSKVTKVTWWQYL